MGQFNESYEQECRDLRAELAAANSTIRALTDHHNQTDQTLIRERAELAAVTAERDDALARAEVAGGALALVGGELADRQQIIGRVLDLAQTWVLGGLEGQLSNYTAIKSAIPYLDALVIALEGGDHE